jgi:hypothetical protein
MDSRSFDVPYLNAAIKKVLNRLADRLRAAGADVVVARRKFTVTGSEEVLDRATAIAVQWRESGEYDAFLALHAEEEDSRSTRSPKASTPPKPVTSAELLRLHLYERELQPHIASFIHAGRLLSAIRHEKLYRGDNGQRTFEQYCLARWGISREHAYRLIESAATAELVLPNGPQRPLNERTARELTAVRRRRPDWLAPVAAAVSNAHRRATARDYRTAARAVLTLPRSASVEEAVAAVEVALDERAPDQHTEARRLESKRIARAVQTLARQGSPEEVRSGMAEADIEQAAYSGTFARRWLDRFLESFLADRGSLSDAHLRAIREGEDRE